MLEVHKAHSHSYERRLSNFLPDAAELRARLMRGSPKTCYKAMQIMAAIMGVAQQKPKCIERCNRTDMRDMGRPRASRSWGQATSSSNLEVAQIAARPQSGTRDVVEPQWIQWTDGELANLHLAHLE